MKRLKISPAVARTMQRIEALQQRAVDANAAPPSQSPTTPTEVATRVAGAHSAEATGVASPIAVGQIVPPFDSGTMPDFTDITRAEAERVIAAEGLTPV